VTSRAVEVSHLYIIFTEVADKHVDKDRHNVAQEADPIFELESYRDSSHHHEENAAWSENRTNEQDNLPGKKGECLFCKKHILFLTIY
jgi:hypothetical protein